MVAGVLRALTLERDVLHIRGRGQNALVYGVTTSSSVVSMTTYFTPGEVGA